MSPAATGPGQVRAPAGQAAWVAYLDELEAAVRELDDRMQSGRPVLTSGLAELRAPAGPLPPRLHERRILLLAMLEDVTARARVRRDAIVEELAGLPRRRGAPSNDRQTSLGSLLDVQG